MEVSQSVFLIRSDYSTTCRCSIFLHMYIPLLRKDPVNTQNCTSKTEIAITPMLICFMCFGSSVENEELTVHPVDNLAIISNI